MYKAASLQDVMKMVGTPVVHDFMRAQGLRPGPRRGRGNVLSWEEEQEFNENRKRAIRQAAAGDPEPMKVLKGLYTMLGQNFGERTPEQIKSLNQMYAGVAPYLMAYDPEFFDAMHGSQGSQASLVAAIMSAHRHQDMTVQEATKLADSISQEMLADPAKLRGFSLRELGDIYGLAAKEGYVGRAMKDADLMDELPALTGVMSAVRDEMGPRGFDTEDIPGMFDYVRQQRMMYPDKSLAFVEGEIRRGTAIRRSGGVMGQLIAGKQRGTQSMATLEAQNRKLTEQGKKSTVGQMVAATAAAAAAGAIVAGTPAMKYLEQAQNGFVQDLNPSTWAEMMAQSGSDRSTAMSMLHSRGAWDKHMTPELASSIRMSQSRIDHGRFIDAAYRKFPGSDPNSLVNREAMLNRVANRAGARTWGDYQDIHGQHMQGLAGVMSRGMATGQSAKGQSGVGQGDWMDRGIDMIKGVTPGNVPTLPQAAGTIMGGIAKAPAPTPTPVAGAVAQTDLPEPMRLKDQFGKTPDFMNQTPGALQAPKLAADRARTICVDLDGTLATHYEKFDPDSIPGPRPGAKDAMEIFRKKGYQVIINTVRGDVKQVKAWLKEHDIPYDYVNENPNQPEDASDKLIADVYIDDRGVDARPAWRKIVEQVVPRVERLKKKADARVRVVLPFGDEHLLEKLNNPAYPENLGKRRFPGGGIEEGESPEQAAARELFEELGIRPRADQFETLGSHDNNAYLQLKDHGLEPGS